MFNHGCLFISVDIRDDMLSELVNKLAIQDPSSTLKTTYSSNATADSACKLCSVKHRNGAVQ